MWKSMNKERLEDSFGIVERVCIAGFFEILNFREKISKNFSKEMQKPDS